MRKKTVLYGIAIALALVASTLALPAPRSSDAGPADAALRAPLAQTPGPITVHRLLRDHLDWTLRLVRTLGLLQPTPAPDVSYGTNTIIDEPDPAGRSKDGNGDPLPGTRPRPVNRDPNPYQEGANPNATPFSDFG